jgi:nicotinate-nucleotide--dimethylbenzimidazole phosphoribosyltransferase
VRSPLDIAIARIQPPDPAATFAARQRQLRLTKPAGSLGTLERLHVQLSGILRTPLPTFERPAILVCAADHGVAHEGVSAYPKQVTAEMVRNFAAGGAAINSLARDANARLMVADLGVDWRGAMAPQGVHTCSLGPGTRNLAVGPAMLRDEARRSVEVGISLAEHLVADGADLIALGEMGIANTTSASAIIADLAGQRPADVTGFGTGIDRETWLRKVAIVERALARPGHGPDDPLGTLSEVGGFEIGALAGAMLGGAAAGRPIVLDGLIVGAAALIAHALCPAVQSYLIASHRSVEPGHRAALELLELEPLMDLGLRLGEGSGAAIALHLIRLACRLPREMATFSEAGVSEQAAVSDQLAGGPRPASAP